MPEAPESRSRHKCFTPEAQVAWRSRPSAPPGWFVADLPACSGTSTRVRNASGERGTGSTRGRDQPRSPPTTGPEPNPRPDRRRHLRAHHAPWRTPPHSGHRARTFQRSGAQILRALPLPPSCLSLRLTLTAEDSNSRFVRERCARDRWHAVLCAAFSREARASCRSGLKRSGAVIALPRSLRCHPHAASTWALAPNAPFVTIAVTAAGDGGDCRCGDRGGPRAVTIAFRAPITM